MRRFVALTFLVSAFALTGPAPASGQAATEQPPPRTLDIAPHVAEASLRFGMPEDWIYAVLRTESAGRVGAVSSAGAMGLMQLMPGTWARQRARFALGADPFDPRDNILAGTSYLREMYDNYGPEGFLAAYNAGPGRYEKWRDRGVILPAETRAYVAKIAPMLRTGRMPTVVTAAISMPPARVPWSRGALFASRPESEDGAPGGTAAAAPSPSVSNQPPPLDGLFAPVSASGSR